MSLASVELLPPVAAQAIPSRLPRREIILCLTMLFATCLALGWGATRLNARLYATNQPFFDSLSYHATNHRVMIACREQGLLTALGEAFRGETICLPYLLAAIAGLFCEPSRHVGIWIQVAELVVFCWSLWAYFIRVLRVAPWGALFAVAPFFLLRCLFMSNGGLSDYRMDLSLMLLFGTTCLWYLIAVRSTDLWPYVLLGVCCGATCLFRGTAPVYFLLTLGPVLAWDLVFLRSDRRHCLGLGLGGAIAIILSLWFYILKFEQLYYYYFIWNSDANAHLALRESCQHFLFVAGHIGYPVLYYLVAFQAVVIWARLRGCGYSLPDMFANLRRDFQQLDLRPLWLGIVPALFLTLRGAGLNPFVSMPSVIGICLFGLFPLPLGRGLNLNWQMSATLAAVLAVCSAQIATEGWNEHGGNSPYSMAAHQQTLDIMLADAQTTGQSEARFATTHSFFLSTRSLRSVVLFDRANAQFTTAGASEQGVQLIADRLMDIYAEADWQQVSGSNDADKVNHLVDQAGQHLDYLVIPTTSCSQMLRDHVAHNVVNRYAVTLRERLLAGGNWEAISPEIHNRDDEIVQVFRNRGRYMARRSIPLRR